MHGVRPPSTRDSNGNGGNGNDHDAERDAAARAQHYEEMGREARAVLAACNRAAADDPASLPADEILRRTVRVLERNPEEYTLWNRRRQALLAKARSAQCATAMRERAGTGDSDGDGSSGYSARRRLDESQQQGARAIVLDVDTIESELALTERALRANAKSYSAWQHRLWLLEHGAGGGCRDAAAVQRLDELYRRELKLCEAVVLAADDRNFHGWLHRMRVRRRRCGRAGDAASRQRTARDNYCHHDDGDEEAEEEEEEKFTRAKLMKNCSNYSAYHYRSVLGSKLGVQRELELVHNAVFTEPNDQSAWFYYRWLLREFATRASSSVPSSSSSSASSGGEARIDVHAELVLIDQLVQLEPEARWALRARADMLSLLGRVEEAAAIYRERLARLDSMRRGMYLDLAARVEARRSEQAS